MFRRNPVLAELYSPATGIVEADTASHDKDLFGLMLAHLANLRKSGITDETIRLQLERSLAASLETRPSYPARQRGSKVQRVATSTAIKTADFDDREGARLGRRL